MLISEGTRRNICDELRIDAINWYGRLNEIAFLKRIFNLTELPTTDGRFENMEQDIWQHRFNNNDWQDDWIFDDTRLNLMKGSDETFLLFLSEMLHPLVRIDEEEREKLIELFNDYLKDDGFKLVPENTGRKLRYHSVKIDENHIDIENIDKISRPFIKEQLEKCDKKLADGDYDGAITNARSLLEDVLLRDLHKQITGSEGDASGDLTDYYKKIKGLLHLSESTQADNSLKMITSGITSIVNGIASVRNTMSDSHSREAIAYRHHAKLVVNSTKTLVDFLYDVFEYQKLRLEKYWTAMFGLPSIRFGAGQQYKTVCQGLKDRNSILSIATYKDFHGRLDGIMKRILINELIRNFEINCFDDADRFFISIVILFDTINSNDIQAIYEKTKGDSQADFKLKPFLLQLREIKPDFLTQEMIDYIAPISKIEEDIPCMDEKMYLSL